MAWAHFNFKNLIFVILFNFLYFIITTYSQNYTANAIITRNLAGFLLDIRGSRTLHEVFSDTCLLKQGVLYRNKGKGPNFDWFINDYYTWVKILAHTCNTG